MYRSGDQAIAVDHRRDQCSAAECSGMEINPLTLDEVKADMINEARQKHGADIFPTARRSSLAECFNVFNDCFVFWFNLPNGSTSVVTRKIDDFATLQMSFDLICDYE